MVQPAGSVAVTVKNNVGYVNFAGTQALGDGATQIQVSPKTAAELSDAGALVAASDVFILATDFAVSIQSLNSTQRT